MDTQTLECSDGATLELPDGYRYRVSIEPDHGSSINDYDSDGRVEWVNSRSGHDQRPSSMDGGAMKLHTQAGAFWWQPYDDIMGWQDADGAWQHAKWAQLPRSVKDRERQRVADLVEYGFVGVVVELERLCEMGHWHGVEVASLWGLEWNVCDAEYGHEVVAELVAELADAMATGVTR